ncbi:MAG TPA: hypothetical protein VH437_06915 [Terriglobales bacterium]
MANFALALFSALPMASRVSKVADHSLQSHRLIEGFDLAAFVELASNPDVGFWSKTADSLWYSLIFFAFAMFLCGGILETYRTDRKLPTAEFFHACGMYFWRWLRLCVFLLIVLAPVFLFASGVYQWSDKLAEDAGPEMLGFWVEVAGMLLVLLLLMAIRLWFDMAQVYAVAENERSMRRSLISAFRLTRQNLGSLFWIYFRISALAWIGLSATWWMWLHLPFQRTGTTFFLFEVLLAFWLGTRLWQRANETLWYERYAEMRISEPAPVEATAAGPAALTPETSPASPLQ